MIAFDPGEQTGWATGTIEPDRLVIEDHGWDRWWPLLLKYHRTMSENPLDVTVFETWRLTTKGSKGTRGSDMPWSQFIGGVKLTAHLFAPRAPLVGQEPAIKERINEHMGEARWLPRSEVEHNRDAVRHLVYYAVIGCHVKTVQLIDGSEVTP